MAIPDTIIKTGTIPAGQTDLPVANIPSQVVGYGLVVARWADPTVLLSAKFEISYDSGQTWSFLGGWTDEPGGVGLPPIFETRSISGVGTTTRRARGSVTATAPITTTISLRLLDGTEPRVL